MLGRRRMFAFVITIAEGTRVATVNGNYTPTQGQTRLDAFRAIRADAAQQTGFAPESPILFFSLEPDRF